MGEIRDSPLNEPYDSGHANMFELLVALSKLEVGADSIHLSDKDL